MHHSKLILVLLHELFSQASHNLLSRFLSLHHKNEADIRALLQKIDDAKPADLKKEENLVLLENM